MLADAFAHRFCDQFPDLLQGSLVVAYSGGADSTALLHLLTHSSLDLRLTAVHVHHHHRGTDADEDAEHCQQHCLELGVPFELIHLRPEAHPPEGREGAWRRQRYQALQAFRRRLGADAVATGHQADDVDESVLLGIVRGGGPRALAGIRTRSGDGTVVRPLLGWSRPALVAWLEEQGIPWRTDPSNQSLHHLRNRIRHELLPVLERIAPSVRRQLQALAEALAEDEACLASLAAHGGQLDPWHPHGGVAVSAVRSLAPAVRRRWLAAQAHANGIGPITRAQIAELDRLLDTGTPRSVTLRGRWRVRQARQRLWLEPPTVPSPWQVTLGLGEEQDLPLPGWRARLRPADTPAQEPSYAQLAVEVEQLTVRSPRDADTVSSAGTRRPLGSILGRHLPRHLRLSWPVFCDGGTLLWLPGIWAAPETCGGASSSPRGNVVEVLYR